VILDEPQGVAAPLQQQSQVPQQVPVRKRSSISPLVMFLVIVVALLIAYACYQFYKGFLAKPAPADPQAQPPPPSAPPQSVAVKPLLPSAPTTASWDSVTKGTQLLFSDPISLEDARSLHSSATSLEVTVNRVLRVKEEKDLCEWFFVYGTSEFEDQEVLLKVKLVDGEQDFACFTRDVEGSREELIDRDECFLFSEPSEEGQDPQSLRYAAAFTRKLADDREDSFNKTHSHELHGRGTYQPVERGIESVFTTVMEWTNVDREGNQYLALETGNGKISNVEGWWGDRLFVNHIAIA
jgi:hypothetical protein